MSLPSVTEPVERMAPVPGNKYRHGDGTRHCAHENACPNSTETCPCGETVKAAAKQTPAEPEPVQVVGDRVVLTRWQA